MLIPTVVNFILHLESVITHNLIKSTKFTNSENDYDELLTDIFKNHVFTSNLISEISSISLPSYKEIDDIDLIEQNVMQ